MYYVLFVILAFVYVILSILVGFWAVKKGRSYWVWLLISILVTPFICVLILACMGKNNEANRGAMNE
jgi:hypothetical protein